MTNTPGYYYSNGLVNLNTLQKCVVAIGNIIPSYIRASTKAQRQLKENIFGKWQKGLFTWKEDSFNGKKGS